ncbi:GNAT family N-acetyltransferase [Peribacillus simplex]|uniref:GNAT family N-acetyltransferase n=1 Tax=Peribacillus simplex TaxID=1478 RepID=UPI000B6757E4|nr:GNAT family N-acetyltransferase [Peribacillus simplex]MDW7613879.1 GNAT family N-acetyltransferase [Peribacillus simplex]SNT01848.1 Ribosomal protein S18 acetylase RimI [Bacillus sp. OK838]
MYIRKATPEDADKAAILTRLAIKEIAEVLTGETEEERILYVLADLFRKSGNRISYENTFVSEHDGQVSGLIIAYHGKDAESLDEPIVKRLRTKMKDPSVTLDKEAEMKDFYLDTLCVDPNFQGKGIGSELIQYVEGYAKQKGYPRVSLVVENENEGANRLYSRLGYKEMKTITISGHEFGYMVKEIEEPPV